MTSDGDGDRARSLRDDALNIPNLLTVGRILIIPVVLWLMAQPSRQARYIAAAVYLGAAITDMLDGYLARRLGVVSVLGKFLDPLADKLLVMATLVYLIPAGRIDAWVVVLLLAREISITGLRSIASSEGVIIAAGQLGKHKTAFQMLGILCLIVADTYDLGALGLLRLEPVGRTLVYLSLLFSLTSAVEYVAGFVKALDGKP